jgi:hypothetical protein
MRNISGKGSIFEFIIWHAFVLMKTIQNEINKPKIKKRSNCCG